MEWLQREVECCCLGENFGTCSVPYGYMSPAPAVPIRCPWFLAQHTVVRAHMFGTPWYSDTSSSTSSYSFQFSRIQLLHYIHVKMVKLFHRRRCHVCAVCVNMSSGSFSWVSSYVLGVVGNCRLKVRGGKGLCLSARTFQVAFEHLESSWVGTKVVHNFCSSTQ